MVDSTARRIVAFSSAMSGLGLCFVTLLVLRYWFIDVQYFSVRPHLLSSFMLLTDYDRRLRWTVFLAPMSSSHSQVAFPPSLWPCPLSRSRDSFYMLPGQFGQTRQSSSACSAESRSLSNTSLTQYGSSPSS
jgi:hypothetical protein